MSDNDWISTKDRMPELEYGNYSDDVLILCRNGEYAVACYVDDENFKYWASSDEKSNYYKKNVSYWQPLPELPEDLR